MQSCLSVFCFASVSKGDNPSVVWVNAILTLRCVSSYSAWLPHWCPDLQSSHGLGIADTLVHSPCVAQRFCSTQLNFARKDSLFKKVKPSYIWASRNIRISKLSEKQQKGNFLYGCSVNLRNVVTKKTVSKICRNLALKVISLSSILR